MTKREKTKQLFVELINEQLKPHGVTYDEVKEDPQWYMNYATDEETEKQFMEYCTQRIREVLKVNKKLAEKETQWFILQWGLTLEKNTQPIKNSKIQG